MNKPILIIAILISLILIGLSWPIPLRSSTAVSLASVANKPSTKPVIVHYDNPSSHFISAQINPSYAAHRGAPTSTMKPENSLTAFKSSKKLGYKIIETDLRLTKDGQWIIMHDYTLDRTTTGKGTVKTKTLKEIEKLNLKDSGDEKLLIPTLGDFLGLCSSEGLIPILDIKPNEKEISSENYDSLLQSLAKYNLLDKSIFTSPSKEVLMELRKRNDETTIAVMMDATQDNLTFVKELKNAFIYSNYERLTDENIDLIKNNNVRFGVWTINDGKVAKHFFERGAILVVTDELLNEI